MNTCRYLLHLAVSFFLRPRFNLATFVLCTLAGIALIESAPWAAFILVLASVLLTAAFEWLEKHL